MTGKWQLHLGDISAGPSANACWFKMLNSVVRENRALVDRCEVDH